MLEMVIVLPLLLLLLFGLVEFGILFGRWLAVNNSAREGAREAIVVRTNCVAASVESEVVAAVQAYTSALGVSITSTDVVVPGQCMGAGSESSVTVTLPITFEVIDGLVPALGPTLNLTATSVMRNEG